MLGQENFCSDQQILLAMLEEQRLTNRLLAALVEALAEGEDEGELEQDQPVFLSGVPRSG